MINLKLKMKEIWQQMVEAKKNERANALKEVILHIGLHKTGSTSIQSALKGYDKNGTKTVSFENENHSIPMYTIFSKNRYDYHIWKNAGISKVNIDRNIQKYLKIILADIDDKSKNKIIISGEDISSLSPDEKFELLQFFRKKGITVNVIVYVRNPLDWVTSVYQQMHKDGHPPEGKIATNYQSALEPFLEFLGKDHILVFPFDEVRQNHSSIAQHFSKVLSLELPNVYNLNESLTEFQLSLIHSLNNIRLQTNANHYKTRQKIVDIICQYQFDSASKKSFDKKYFSPLLHDMVEKDVAWLKNNFSIDFTSKKKDNYDDINDYFRKILKDNSEDIINVFQNIGVNYCNNISIQDNFMNAFIVLETGIVNFSKEKYLQLNPDVKAAGVNPYQHYLEFGIAERRRIQ